MNLDGHVNILDVIGVVQLIIGGNQQQAMSWIYVITVRVVKDIELSGTYRWDIKALPSGIYNIHNNMEITTITILK